MKTPEVTNSPQIHMFTGFDKSELLSGLIKSGMRVTKIVVPSSKKYEVGSTAIRKLASQYEIEVRTASIQQWESLIDHSVSESVLLSARFPLKIPRQVFGAYQFAINIHPTLLPRFRGRYLEPVLIAGESESGVTLHLIEDDYDTGPIVEQVKYAVGRFDTVETLLRKAGELELDLVLSAIRKLRDPNFSPMPQDPTAASEFFQPRTPSDSFIPSSTRLIDALNVVRASNSKTHPVYTVIDGQKVVIAMWRPHKPASEADGI